MVTMSAMNFNISKDIQEWLLLDNQVCSNWVRLASGLQLGHHVPDIVMSVNTVIGVNRDRSSLSKLLRCWHKEKPRSFTLKTLLTLLHRLNLRKMEMWIRIITSRHYQHIRQEILNRRGSSGHTNSWILSENSPIMLHPGSLLNVSQDSGVSDMECSYTTHNATYISHTDTDNNDYYDMQDSLLSPRCLLTPTTNISLVKHPSDNFQKSSNCHHISLSTAQKGSVFDILFKPEGKALTRISDAWIEKMKRKKRHRWKITRFKCSSESTNQHIKEKISIEKYFDNLVTILQHSATCIDDKISSL